MGISPAGSAYGLNLWYKLDLYGQHSCNAPSSYWFLPYLRKNKSVTLYIHTWIQVSCILSVKEHWNKSRNQRIPYLNFNSISIWICFQLMHECCTTFFLISDLSGHYLQKPIVKYAHFEGDPTQNITYPCSPGTLFDPLSHFSSLCPYL